MVIIPSQLVLPSGLCEVKKWGETTKGEMSSKLAIFNFDLVTQGFHLPVNSTVAMQQMAQISHGVVPPVISTQLLKFSKKRPPKVKGESRMYFSLVFNNVASNNIDWLRVFNISGKVSCYSLWVD